MRKFSTVGLLAVLSMLAALLLTACGDNTATAPAPTTAAAAATTAPAATTAAATTAATATTAAATTTTAAATTAAGTTTAAATTAAATTAPVATTAAATTSAATTAAGTTSAAATGGKKLKVGFVTDIGRIDDKSFNQSSWEGVQKYAKEAGVEAKYIETKDQKDYATNIKQFLDQKYDVIVTVGFLMADATVAAAKANPNVLFIGVDQGQDPKATISNLTGLVFEEDKAGFLAGVLAAGMSQKGKIGGVFGTKSVPAVLRFGEGYKAGAAWMDANNKALVKAGSTTVTSTYHPDGDNAFNDPAWGAQQTQSLVQAGNDVVFGGGGATGNGAVEAGAGAGIWVIGVDTDQYLTLPKAAPKMLSSATKRLTDGVYDLLKSASAGTIKGGNSIGPVGLAPFHDADSAVSAELKAVIAKVDAGLKDGSIKTGVTA